MQRKAEFVFTGARKQVVPPGFGSPAKHRQAFIDLTLDDDCISTAATRKGAGEESKIACDEPDFISYKALMGYLQPDDLKDCNLTEISEAEFIQSIHLRRKQDPEKMPEEKQPILKRRLLVRR
jgi:hypothetical protein